MPPSPLLFAIAIKPLAEAIRAHFNIHGITTYQRQHRISLYADDVLLFIKCQKSQLSQSLKLSINLASFWLHNKF